MTPASLHPDVTIAGNARGWGVTIGNAPSAVCPARTSAMKRRMNASTSMLKEAASRKTWMSPIHPRRLVALRTILWASPKKFDL